MTNIVNRSPYLDNDRTFPKDADLLSRELDRAYVETAQAVNDRTIGIYPANRPSITGNAWYPTSKKFQSLRQIYPFTTTANIPHEIDLNIVEYMGNCFGSYTDGTNWYGIPFSDSVSPVAGQLNFSLDGTNILFGVGAGAPAVTKGIIVLEWITNV